jgi:hypothetical protein
MGRKKNITQARVDKAYVKAERIHQKKCRAYDEIGDLHIRQVELIEYITELSVDQYLAEREAEELSASFDAQYQSEEEETL